MYTPRNLKRWAMPDNYSGALWPAYYSAGVGQSRDSSDLEKSNFATMLTAIGGESETVTIVRESHWAVGWVEWIAIHQDDETALRIADEQQDRLAVYPALDEDDWAAREAESADTVWRDCYSATDRIRYIRDHRDQIIFVNYRNMLAAVRGHYFPGYAPDIL